jgi:hypothetical protein
MERLGERILWGCVLLELVAVFMIVTRACEFDLSPPFLQFPYMVVIFGLVGILLLTYSLFELKS